MSASVTDSIRPKKDYSSNVYHGVPTIDDGDSRREKPWQRVIYEVTRKGTHLYEPVKSVPSALFIVLLGVYLLLGYFAQLNEDNMPTIIKEVDVARDDATTFSEEAAWRYMNMMLGLEPRVAGTRYHLQKTADLKQLLDGIAGQSSLPVRTDWQMVDGDYWLDFTIPYVNAYQNVSNIVALLEGESGYHSNGTIGTSLLVNCHYDSVPYAMGAGDNMLFCASMMETLSKLSRRQKKFKHNIIFLFNGAEENPLQGSHAFLKHPWSKGITNVVNLDAAGMNGKPIVFQVTDTRLLNAYSSHVTRPSGQSVGEFLFKTGIIPSDTDFRIWRNFGDFHGLDIAFVKWGSVYHTRYDHPSLVQPGVLQNSGHMLLTLISTLADMEELKTQIEPQAAVYYDFLHWFLVTYSFTAAVAVDVLTALYGVVSVAYYVWLVGPRWSTVKELLFAVLGRVASMLAGGVITFLFGLIMVASTSQLRYLSEMWVVVPLYWIPYIVTAVCIAQLLDRWRTKRSGLNRSIRSLQAQAATRLILAAILLVLSCVPFVTTLRYIFAVPLFILSTFSLATLTVVRYVRLAAWQQLLMEVIFSLPTTMFLMSIALKLNAIMIPTMGRTPTNSPDYIIALVNIGLASLVCSSVSGIELLFSRKRLWVALTPVALVSVVLMFVPFAPFRDDGPTTQRHYWFHSEIITYNYNNEVTDRYAGVLVTKHDVYSLTTVPDALRARGINVNIRTDFREDCQRYVHCNLPLYRVRFGSFLQNSLLLSLGPPESFTADVTVSRRACVGETCQYDFIMNGPAHSLITIVPRANVNVTSWSLATPLQSTSQFQGRPLYVIIHSHPTFSERFPPFTFTLNLIVPLSQQSGPALDLAYHAHRIHHPEHYTQEYRNLIQNVPKYFNIAHAMSIRKNYVF